MTQDHVLAEPPSSEGLCAVMTMSLLETTAR